MFKKGFIPIRDDKVERKLLNLNLYNKYYIRSVLTQNKKSIFFLDNDNKLQICPDFRRKLKPI